MTPAVVLPPTPGTPVLRWQLLLLEKGQRGDPVGIDDREDAVFTAADVAEEGHDLGVLERAEPQQQAFRVRSAAARFVVIKI